MVARKYALYNVLRGVVGGATHPRWSMMPSTILNRPKPINIVPQSSFPDQRT